MTVRSAGFYAAAALWPYAAVLLAVLLIETNTSLDFLPTHLQLYWTFYLGLTAIACWLVLLLQVALNERLTRRQRNLWLLAVFFFGFVAQPIYYWLHLRHPLRDLN